MLTRWLRRRRWRQSPQFWEAVALAVEQARQFPGDQPADFARRKAKRSHQPVRRKWVWREAARRLEAAETGQEPRSS